MKLIMKKLYLLISIVFTLTLCSCELTGSYYILPDLTGLNRQEITEVLATSNITYEFKFEKMISKTEDEYDKFVKYEGSLVAGSKINLDYYLYIYTSPLPLDTHISDEVNLTKDYHGKSFVKDGIGEVYLYRAIDGDTAHFTDDDGNYIKLRFLGIDTPESTYDKDPWGKAASKYAARILENAETIVLERGDTIKDMYDRYLGYCWCDGKLLNLIMIEQAYSNSTLSSNSEYFQHFINAEMATRRTGRRFYGEIDPNYDYVNHRFID